ncbi:MAG TPA: hypothetical protein VFQ23_04880 [Anaerolineales bacterium]|nr:hypothetical protein [Anaerolineales bacterium]
MNEQQVIKRAFVPVLGNVFLVLLGVVISLAMVEMLMRAFPNWIPPDVRVNPPARRVKAFIDESYYLRQSDGDLFYYMRGQIAPLSPDEDEVVAQVQMVTDANGFRNSPEEQATYDIVALGDSFTRASGVAYSWPQKLAEYAKRDVLNLGDVGFGPQDELKVLQQYGIKKQPQWVIMAYFEGNDLYDSAAYEQANPFILFRFGKYALNQSIKSWNEKSWGVAPVKVRSNYQYPINIAINNKDLEVAFFSYYFSWLSVDRAVIESSQNFRLVSETILQVLELSEAAGARFLLVYVPSKEHVYLPYLNDENILERVFTGVPAVELDEAGFLQFTNERVKPEPTRRHMDDQAGLLADFAADHMILYLDLTSTFQEEAAAGAELYYRFDTHWNQHGHDLAASLINKYIEKIH